MLSIFQTETTALESQVASLQAQLSTAQQRIALLNETELLAGDSLGALKTAINKVSALAPDAIASLRAAVFNLFNDDDNDGNDGNGNQPAPQPEPLNGQVCELTSPWYPLREDAPRLAIKEEADRTAPDVAVLEQVESELIKEEISESEMFDLIPVSDVVAYFKNTQTGEIASTYLAGNNKSRLKDWGSWLCNQHSVGSGFELREAKRMTAYKYELKIWGMSLKQIQRLAETDTTKSVPSRYHVASFPVAANLLACNEAALEDVEEVSDRVNEDAETNLEAAPDTQAFQVGDRVQITSERHGVDLLNQTGIITAATEKGAAVNVAGTMRWFCSDEIAIIETSSPRSAADDLFPAVETPASASVPGYTMNPIGRAGAAANWKAMQVSGRGVNLKSSGTGIEPKNNTATAEEEQEIKEGDWVELLVNSDRYQVDSVTSEGVNLVTDDCSNMDGNMCMQRDEVKLIFRAPSDWKPF